MLVITVTLLHRVIRAASAADLALSGETDLGDWPPSPARLLAALVAADGTRSRCSVTNGSELTLVAGAPPPTIYASPDSLVLRSPLRRRYVVVNGASPGAMQDYPGRTGSEIRPGVRLSPFDPRVVYAWPDLSATHGEFEGLRARAARVGYLGCSDTPVHLTVGTELPFGTVTNDAWRPAEAGDTDLPVPWPGQLEVLDRIFDEWTAGRPARRSWYPAMLHRYASPAARPIDVEPETWGRAITMRLIPSVAGELALRVAETLKRATLDRYDRKFGEPPPEIHGHGAPGGSGGYQVAQWLALPDVGNPHSGGRVHGCAVMLPASIDPVVAAQVADALWGSWDLAIPGLPTRVVASASGARVPWAATPGRWRGPARTWTSVYPVVHERRRRHGPTMDDVSAWCRHAGHPVPIGARLSPVPILPGSPRLRPDQVFRDRDGSRRPYSYVTLHFRDPIRGPVVLGRARQFGMGLMAPIANA